MFKDILTSTSSGPRYYTSFPDGTVVFFRLLTLKEYKAVTSLKTAFRLEDFEFYEQVYNLCAEPGYKDLIGLIKAGVPISVGQFIYFNSFNYDTIESDLNRFRSEYNPDEIYESMKMIINIAFDAYKPEDLELMDRPSLMRLFVRAETKMSIIHKDYKPMKLTDIRSGDNKSETIDFATENRELGKAMNGAGGEYAGERRQPQTAVNVHQIREAATARANRRKK